MSSMAPPPLPIVLGLVGDVMLGRGVDAMLHDHVDGTLHEGCMQHAEGYVRLAERELGHRLPRSRPPLYVWGDLVPALRGVDSLIVNLETAITTVRSRFLLDFYMLYNRERRE